MACDMKRIVMLVVLLTAVFVNSQTADARRRIRHRKASAEQTVIRKITLEKFAPIIFGTDSVVMDSPLRTIEDMGMSSGAVIYVCMLPEVKAPGLLILSDCRDFAQVFIDDENIGTIDRSKNEQSIKLPPIHDGQELKILVDAKGRADAGKSDNDFVGLEGFVTLVANIDGNELTLNLKQWTILAIPDGFETAVKAFADVPSTGDAANLGKSGYYRFHVVFSRSGEIYLNMRDFGRGEVYVNGNYIGKFSNKGSLQAIEVLRRYLKRGLNEVVVFDVLGPSSADAPPTLHAQDKPYP